MTLALANGSVAAVGSGKAANDAPRPRLEVPFAALKPALEAGANDPAWEKAAVIPSLPLMVGEEEKKKPVATEVRLLWDEGFLYVRFVCQADEIYAPYKTRDANHHEGDVAEIFLDPSGDQRSQFEFQINPENAILDLVMTTTADPVIDRKTLCFDGCFLDRNVRYSREWNCDGIRTATSKIEHDGRLTGWIAEAALPARAILRRMGTDRYAAGQQLRANFLRYERPLLPDGKREWIPMNWAPTMSGCPHFSPASMGYLKLCVKEDTGTTR